MSIVSVRRMHNEFLIKVESVIQHVTEHLGKHMDKCCGPAPPPVTIYPLKTSAYPNPPHVRLFSFRQNGRWCEAREVIAGYAGDVGHVP